MKTHDEKIAQLTLAAIYPLYLKKIEKKGRTAQELDTVIQWLTGLSSQEINQAIQDQLTFDELAKGRKMQKSFAISAINPVIPQPYFSVYRVRTIYATLQYN